MDPKDIACKSETVFIFIYPIYSIVDGGWSRWGAWSQCTRTCGGGRQSRTRSCTNPPPGVGGRDCLGIRAQFRICNRNGCSGKNACSLMFKD